VMSRQDRPIRTVGSAIAEACRYRLHRLALATLRVLFRERARDRGSSDLEQIVLVLHSAFGMGGTIRSTITQANQLVREGSRVTLVSVTRGREQHRSFFHIDERVELRVLDDPLAPREPGPVRRLLSALPSVLFHPDETRRSRMSVYRDLALLRELRRHRGGVVVGTRAGINVAVATTCRDAVIRIGQEHVPFGSYPPRLLNDLSRSYPRLHGLWVLSQADEKVAQRFLFGASTAICVIPNALPNGGSRTSAGSREVIATAGRLSRGKRQDVLIRAFARVASRHPTWELRIYGEGPRRLRLLKLIERLDLQGRVRLMGASDQLEDELAECSIFALSSEMEAFGIVILEAMRAQLAIVSTACDHGPREIITDGVDGILVPPNDPREFARALHRLMSRPQLRQRLAAGALATSRRYEASVVSEEWRAAYELADRVRRKGF
jgi:glycosyltransferase involved in cell wall biosynthesis